MFERFNKSYDASVKIIISFLSFGLLLGIGLFAVESVKELSVMDWGKDATFYEFLHRSLLIVIAVELVYSLLVHDFRVIIEIIGFVIARKMLKPELASQEILLLVIAFCILIVVRRYFACDTKNSAS